MTMLGIQEDYEIEVRSVVNTHRDLGKLSPRNKLLRLIRIEGPIHLNHKEDFSKEYPHNPDEMLSRIDARKNI